MKLHSLITAAVGGLMLAGASMASAGTIVFSSIFASPAISPGYVTETIGSNFDGGNWTVTAGTVSVGNIDIIDNAYSPTPFPPFTNSLAQAVDLDGTTTDGTNPQGAITSALINTTIGDNYALTFWLSGNSGGAAVSSANTFETAVTVAGYSTVNEFSNDSAWTQYALTFIGLGSPVTLNFASINPGGFSGPTLADVTLTDLSGKSATVPLPASALGGSALLGLVAAAKMRSRKNAA